MKVIFAGLLVLLATSVIIAAPVPPPIQPQTAPQPREVKQESIAEPYFDEEMLLQNTENDIKEPLTSDAFLAWQLITQESQIPLPTLTEELINAIYYISIQEELLDKREKWWFYNYNIQTQQDNLKESVNAIQERYRESKNYPKSCEATRFPPWDLCMKMKAFNRAYYNKLEKRIPWEKDREDFIRSIMLECDHCYKIWDNIEDVGSQYSYVFTKRKCLAFLKKEAKEAWDKGEMPPYVPHWRFVEIKY